MSNNESIKEFIQSANVKGMAKFVQPPDSVEYINSVESIKSEDYILIENKHIGDKKHSKHTKREVPQAIVDLKPDLVPPESVASLVSIPNESNNNASIEIGSMPYLYVDVNITDTEMSTIEVFEGDKAETLAREFTIKHDLDERTERKLIEMLKAQMATVL